MHHAASHAVAAIAALIAITSTTPALAQYVINHDVALAGIPNGSGSVMLNDPPGYPLSLTRSGSYVLTSNLIVPYGQTGIYISAAGVTLDLNGFKVVSGVACTRNESTYFVGCAADLASNNTYGVQSAAIGNTVRNGEISGFATGVSMKGGDVVENLMIRNNMTGLKTAPYAGARTLIRGVRAEMNAWSGFYATDALIQGSTASANGGAGFLLGRSMVLDSFAYQNKSGGFEGTNSGQPGLVIGRNASAMNKGADFSATISLGGNVSSNGLVF